MATKNKSLNYLLLGVVGLVWGLIIYKLFIYLTFKEEEEVIMPSPPLKKTSAEDYAIVRDTTTLLLNYRDPFSAGQSAKDPATQRAVQPARSTDATRTPVKPKFSWDFIQYEGFIKSPNARQIIALVRINGKSLMLGEGEEAEHVRLLKNLKDSVKVSSGGKVAFIHLKKQ
jgi:hypothetical protein